MVDVFVSLLVGQDAVGSRGRQIVPVNDVKIIEQKYERLMISLLLVALLLFPFSIAFADTGLVCAIDMGSHNFKLILGEMKEGKYVQHYYAKDRLGVGENMSKTGVISPSKLKGIRRSWQKA